MTTRRLVPTLALIVLAATAAASARAGFTPAWSYLPASVRAQLAAQTGGSLFLPARTPLFYRYRSGAKVVAGTLSVPFTNRVRVRQGVWRWTSRTFTWQVRRLPAKVDCGSWKPVDKTMQLSGNKVYWSASDGTAWRCATDRAGRSFVISAAAAGAPGDVGLGTTVASGLDVSGRQSATTVALSVRPTSVRRGGRVLVSGVAGDCSAGDTVTILSRAFPSTHSFAGVPAVLAQVGSAGRFSATTRIPPSRSPGTYVLTARCGGGNLGVSAHLRVTT